MARPFGTKKIATPEILWQHFLDYKDWVENNPILVHDLWGKEGQSVHREKQRPLTIDGFELYCFNNGIIPDLSHYFANTNGNYSDYLTICTLIKKNVRLNQIEGGMAGIFNTSITQRLNNLVEKSETVIKEQITEIVLTDATKDIDS